MKKIVLPSPAPALSNRAPVIVYASAGTVARPPPSVVNSTRSAPEMSAVPSNSLVTGWTATPVRRSFPMVTFRARAGRSLWLLSAVTRYHTVYSMAAVPAGRSVLQLMLSVLYSITPPRAVPGPIRVWLPPL